LLAAEAHLDRWLLRNQAYGTAISEAARTGNIIVDLPGTTGCVATGSTPAETETAIREAIAFHLEGMREDGTPVPPPSSTSPSTSVSASELVASKNRNACGSESTHCRSGRSGNTSSANSAAVSAMRRPPQEGQKPRFLQLNATSFSA
jgi:predicted RNase H-like HicB family nuclease